MASASFHRKIELQSPEDLTYLISNIRRAADAEIERALPQIPGLEKEERRGDDMRVVVERLVEEYIQTVLTQILPNITINGLPPSSSLLSSTKNVPNLRIEAQHEPLNTKLFSHAQNLMNEEALLLEEIAKLRRTVPQGKASREKETWREVGERDDAFMRELEGREGEGNLVLVDGKDSQEGVKRSWRTAVEGLERSVEGISGVAARVDRAAKAEEYVLKMQR